MSTIFGACPQLQLFIYRLFYSTSISSSPVHHLGSLAEVSSSHPSPLHLHVSIASLCRLSSEYVHGCNISLFARDPGVAFVGEEKQRKDFEIHYPFHVNCFRSMTMDGRSHPLSLIRCHCLVRVHLNCVESMSTSEMSVYLSGVCKAGY